MMINYSGRPANVLSPNRCIRVHIHTLAGFTDTARRGAVLLLISRTQARGVCTGDDHPVSSGLVRLSWNDCDWITGFPQTERSVETLARVLGPPWSSSMSAGSLITGVQMLDNTELYCHTNNPDLAQVCSDNWHSEREIISAVRTAVETEERLLGILLSVQGQD